MDETETDRLAAYVVWVPRNGAREQHVERVMGVVPDRRAIHFWDGHDAIASQFDRRYALTGPCAGIFLVYGPDTMWSHDSLPDAVHAEDAHAREYNRRLPQFDARRFASRVLMLMR